MLALLFLVAGSLAAQASPKPNAADLAAAAFFDHYVEYQRGLEGKSRSEQQAKAEDRAAIEPYITIDFRKRLRAQEKKCAASKDEILEGCDSDPFYCAQEPPRKGAAVVKPDDKPLRGKTAWVGLVLCFESADPKMCDDRMLRVQMQESPAKKWLVHRVSCPHPTTRK